MKTQMLLVRGSSPLQLSAAKKRRLKSWLRKMKNMKMQPALKSQKREMLAVLVVVGILDSKPIKDVDTGLKLDDDELQGDVENQENEAERLQYL